ncbi:MAG TPA: GH25 family lysozyme [Dehalococcoidia bacterium]|nr:GH25 family lysozyme [Dehalococcoidia bacterium]
MRLGVDCSNYSGPLTAESARCLRAAGFDFLIAGTQAASITRQQVAAAVEAGFEVQAYVYLYWSRDTAAEVGRALEALDDLPVSRVWLDCEDAAAGLSPAEVVARIEAAARAGGETPLGIYTGRWWWPPATGDSTAFGHLPLWHAEYTGSIEAPPSADSFRPYGGWRRPAIWQFRGTTRVCGFSVDLNAEVTPLPRPRPPADDQVELQLARNKKRFELALAADMYVFRNGPSDDSVELVKALAGGGAEPFDPPCVIPVPPLPRR